MTVYEEDQRDAAIVSQALYVLADASELHAACNGGTGGWGGTPWHWRNKIADLALATSSLANIFGVTVEDCIAEKAEYDAAAAVGGSPETPTTKTKRKD